MNAPSLFLDYLNNLERLVCKIADNDPDQELLTQQLTSGMFPLETQVRICCNFALRACCQWAQREPIYFDNREQSYSGLLRQVEHSRSFLTELTEHLQPETSAIAEDRAGEQSITMPLDAYLLHFAIPNFFFHLSICYAIARQAGLPIGKGDFDGIHHYTEGFSFV